MPYSAPAGDALTAGLYTYTDAQKGGGGYSTVHQHNIHYLTDTAHCTPAGATVPPCATVRIAGYSNNDTEKGG